MLAVDAADNGSSVFRGGRRLLVGINLVLGGASLVGMALAARKIVRLNPLPIMG